MPYPALAQVALRSEPEDPVAVPTPLASMDSASAGNGKAAAAALPALLPMDQVPQLPQVGGMGGWVHESAAGTGAAASSGRRSGVCLRVLLGCGCMPPPWHMSCGIWDHRPTMSHPATKLLVAIHGWWQELCGIWAYIKWEQAGCPNRAKDEADREYEVAIQELIALLRRWAWVLLWLW